MENTHQQPGTHCHTIQGPFTDTVKAPTIASTGIGSLTTTCVREALGAHEIDAACLEHLALAKRCLEALVVCDHDA